MGRYVTLASFNPLTRLWTSCPLTAIGRGACWRRRQCLDVASTRSSSRTPTGRGTSTDESRVTDWIRREIAAEKSLQLSEETVKVVAEGTTVVLRGQVNTNAERELIEAIAKRTPGVGVVDNQIGLR